MDERRGLVFRRDRGEGCVVESVSSTSNDRFSVGLVMPDPSLSVLLVRALADLAGDEYFFMAADVSSLGRYYNLKTVRVAPVFSRLFLFVRFSLSFLDGQLSKRT